jgi:hypothetical protein
MIDNPWPRKGRTEQLLHIIHTTTRLLQNRLLTGSTARSAILGLAAMGNKIKKNNQLFNARILFCYPSSILPYAPQSILPKKRKIPCCEKPHNWIERQADTLNPLFLFIILNHSYFSPTSHFDLHPALKIAQKGKYLPERERCAEKYFVASGRFRRRPSPEEIQSKK